MKFRRINLHEENQLHMQEEDCAFYYLYFFVSVCLYTIYSDYLIIFNINFNEEN